MNITDQILARIRTQLTTQPRDIEVDTNLGQGYLDSTAMLELILWVGDTFDITIQNEDLIPENFGTVRNIAEFVQTHTSQRVEGLQCDTAA